MSKSLSNILIGRSVKVIDASDPNLVSKTGKIIDETKNMLKISTPDGAIIWIAKSVSVFEVQTAGGSCFTLHGKNILGTPQERISKN